MIHLPRLALTEFSLKQKRQTDVDDTVRHGMAQHGTARHGMAWHDATAPWVNLVLSALRERRLIRSL